MYIFQNVNGTKPKLFHKTFNGKFKTLSKSTYKCCICDTHIFQKTTRKSFVLYLNNFEKFSNISTQIFICKKNYTSYTKIFISKYYIWLLESPIHYSLKGISIQWFSPQKYNINIHSVWKTSKFFNKHTHAQNFYTAKNLKTISIPIPFLNVIYPDIPSPRKSTKNHTSKLLSIHEVLPLQPADAFGRAQRL